jgi:hypothetical protein
VEQVAKDLADFFPRLIVAHFVPTTIYNVLLDKAGTSLLHGGNDAGDDPGLVVLVALGPGVDVDESRDDGVAQAQIARVSVACTSGILVVVLSARQDVHLVSDVSGTGFQTIRRQNKRNGREPTHFAPATNDVKRTGLKVGRETSFPLCCCCRRSTLVALVVVAVVGIHTSHH